MPVPLGGSFTLGSLDVETFPTLHDAAEAMGYAVSCGEQKAAVVTDLGFVTDQVRAGMAGPGWWWWSATTIQTGWRPAPTHMR